MISACRRSSLTSAGRGEKRGVGKQFSVSTLDVRCKVKIAFSENAVISSLILSENAVNLLKFLSENAVSALKMHIFALLNRQ